MTPDKPYCVYIYRDPRPGVNNAPIYIGAGHEQDRDLNAALNLLRLHTFRADEKCTQEPRKPSGSPGAAVLTA